MERVNNGNSALPEGWEWKTLGEVADIVGGGTPRTNEPSNFEGGAIPWVTPADLSGYTSKKIGHGSRYITEKGLSSSSARLLPAGTVLFTSRAPIGYVAIASNPISTNQGFKNFVLKEGILSDYVYWYLKGSKDLAESLASGTTFLELSGAKAKQIPIPVAPFDQQKLIVAEIEKQFSRLDEAVAGLKRVKANLKRYKAAVLKAAVEGKLTEEWRKAHPNVELGAELLKRILAERKKKWEEKNPGKKYIEPAVPDTSNLSELPGRWVWATVAQIGALGEQTVLTGPFGSNLGTEDFKESGVPVLTIGCLKETGISLGKAAYVSKHKAAKLERYKLKAGDMLFSRMAAVGRAGYVSRALEGAIFNYHIMRLRLSEKAILTDYFISYVRGARSVVDYLREINHGFTRDGINTDQLLLMPVALPPVEEQRGIVEELDQKLSVVLIIGKELETNLKRAEHLRQSILKKAFEGNL